MSPAMLLASPTTPPPMAITYWNAAHDPHRSPLYKGNRNRVHSHWKLLVHEPWPLHAGLPQPASGGPAVAICHALVTFLLFTLWILNVGAEVESACSLTVVLASPPSTVHRPVGLSLSMLYDVTDSTVPFGWARVTGAGANHESLNAAKLPEPSMAT